jgi:Peptidase family M28
MYNKIYDFCKVRNKGTIYENKEHIEPPRVQFILKLLDEQDISYQLDKFFTSQVTGYNVILKGNSNRMVVAHHDVNNHTIDNANDNSCSVINAIMIKKLMPDMNVVLLDGEECGGIGSQHLSTQINKGDFGDIEWILNLELTGKGGKYFFIGDYPGPLTNHIKSLFNCPITRTPFNDSVIFRKNGIDSCVINPIPPVKEGKTNVQWDENTYLDYSMLYNCHSKKDSIDTIDINDMKEFVENIVIKILKS